MPESRIESIALQSVDSECLGGFNLRTARATLSEMLSHVGRTQQFHSYTRHDITHVDALLRACDWIIPPQTFASLTVPDALLIVLGIYTHDLGMLVTRDEFAHRNSSGFPAFVASVNGDDTDRGVDLRRRLEAFNNSDREEFLYEEFVRVNHANRVAKWITGETDFALGRSTAARELLEGVLAPLDPIVRSDLALIARSHHLDDLHDTSKYRIARAYGPTDSDLVNLQYAAITLRSADLLHITADRAPAVSLRLISMTDPVGQSEWAKQSAVRNVRPKDVMPDEPNNTIEVHAYFTDPEGYFGLTDYLNYASLQLAQNAKWISESQRRHARAVSYNFPWAKIDTSNIETEGFIPKQFTFTFNQQKVLELLTGHTLYNDTSVSIRELIQNSIDAVRTAQLCCPDKNCAGRVEVTYSTEHRRLSVRDNGTGMTQEIIEKHFLTVGSSRYQSKEFQDEYPQFSSISRFGIGVLSTFMVADSVQVFTRSDGEESGREILLRSVNGHYLVKDLPLGSEAMTRLGEHGTEVVMNLRPSAEFGEIRDLMMRWVIVPDCEVLLIVDGGPALRIGRESATDALEWLLDESLSALDDHSKLKVVSNGIHDGIEVAVALSWNQSYSEWELLQLRPRSSARNAPLSRLPTGFEYSGVAFPLPGACVHGVRVTQSAPGVSPSLAILVNVTGPNAPLTNVARSEFEPGDGLSRLVRRTYREVLDALDQQVDILARSISLRYALREISVLYALAMDSNTENSGPISDARAMLDELRSFRFHAVERSGRVERLSCDELVAEGGFRVAVGPAASDGARFVEWVSNEVSLAELLSGVASATDAFATSVGLPFISDIESLSRFSNLLWSVFEPLQFDAALDGALLLVTFGENANRWLLETSLIDASSDISARVSSVARSIADIRERFRYRAGVSRSYAINSFAQEEIAVAGISNVDGVVAGGFRFFLYDSPHAGLFRELKAQGRTNTDSSLALAILVVACDNLYTSFRLDETAEIQAALERECMELSDERLRGRLVDIVTGASPERLLTPMSVWRRRADRD